MNDFQYSQVAARNKVGIEGGQHSTEQHFLLPEMFIVIAAVHPQWDRQLY